MRGLIPRPGLSLALFLLWLLLTNFASFGMLVLGGLLALGLPFLIKNFWSNSPRLVHPGLALMFFMRVMADILVANWAVARLVIGPVHRLHPAFVEVPLDLRDPFVATILASVVSLTPGTISVDVDRERWILKLHALDVPDSDALVREIKQRYEARLKEIFAC